jgi:hypothetical protein
LPPGIPPQGGRGKPLNFRDDNNLNSKDAKTLAPIRVTSLSVVRLGRWVPFTSGPGTGGASS